MLKESEKDMMKLEPTGMPRATRQNPPVTAVSMTAAAGPVFLGVTCSVPLPR